MQTAEIGCCSFSLKVLARALSMTVTLVGERERDLLGQSPPVRQALGE